MEIGRRLALEKELEGNEMGKRCMNAVWDESGRFIIYPKLLGIKSEFGPSQIADVSPLANRIASFSRQYLHKQSSQTTRQGRDISLLEYLPLPRRTRQKGHVHDGACPRSQSSSSTNHPARMIRPCSPLTTRSWRRRTSGTQLCFAQRSRSLASTYSHALSQTRESDCQLGTL